MLNLYSLPINLLKNTAKNYQKHFLKSQLRTAKGEAVLHEGGAEIKDAESVGLSGHLQDCQGKAVCGQRPQLPRGQHRISCHPKYTSWEGEAWLILSG